MTTTKKVLFSIAIFIVFFGVGEMILRVINFKYANTPLEMWLYSRRRIESNILNNNQSGVIRFRKDAVQFWAPVKSFENELPKEKPDHVVRIATLGDSCTQGCSDLDLTYPKLLENLLKDKLGTKKTEVLNAAVGSYSSFQGLKRLEHVVLKYHPDLLTVYFGWNDHWLSRVEDKDVQVLSDFRVALLNFMEKSRFFQFTNYLITKIRGNTLEQMQQDVFKPRVPLGEYEKNLNRIIDLAEARKIPVILITAPQGVFEDPLPSYFSFLFVPSKTQLEQVHFFYNEVVRKVAAKRGVLLLDMDAMITGQPGSEKLFSDAIHFNADGCDLMAKKLAEIIIKEKLLA